MKKLFNFILAIVCTTMVAKAINSPEPTVVDCGDQLEIKATPETGWHFVEWDDHNTENPRKLTPEDNGAYQAVFALDQHTITFKNYNGATLQSSDWDYGTKPVYYGETPEKPSTVQYSYSFSGWAPIITVVTQSETYVAQFTETARTYPVVITPEDGEGGEGGTVTVDPDGTPVAIGDPVTLTAKANECYEFVQWSNGSTENPLIFTVTEGMIADEKLSLKAQFQKLRYTITFNNYDNTTLQTLYDVSCGDIPMYTGPKPTKPETAKYLYTFNSWFTKPAHRDTTYIASFNEVYRTYPIDVIPDGGEGGEVTVDPADQPVGIGEIITLTATPEECYAFVKWSNGSTENPLTIAVTADLLEDGKVKIKPVFEHKTEYEITFKNEDGTILQSGNVNCGYLPVYTAAAPTKDATVENTYTFDGWDNPLKPAYENATYTATFKATHITYPLDITPEGGEGGEIIVSPTDPVGVGDNITLTAKPDECHTFIQWSNGATANPLTITISEDMLVDGKITLKAQFERLSYTISFNDWNGPIQTGSVLCGDMPTAPADPTRPEDAVNTYKFKGWDKEIVAAKGDETYTAVYTEAKNRSIDTTIYMATFLGKEYNDGTPVTPITEEGTYDYYLDYEKTIAGQLYRYRGILHVIDVREWDADGGVIHGCDAGETRSVDLPWMSKPVQVTLENQPFPPAATSTASYGYDNAICKLNYHYKMIPVDTVYENVTVHGIEEFPLKLTGGYTYDWPADEAPNRAWVKKGLALCEPCGVLPASAPGRKGHQAPGISTNDIMHILSISYEPTKPAVHVSEMIDICQGDTFWFRDTIPFFEKGVYFDTLLNHMGLDSVNMIVVNVYPTYTFEDAIKLHNKKDYTWVGHKDPSTGADWIISEAGVYIDSLKTIHSCDSIYQLNVTNIPLWEVLEDSVVCKDATPIEWRGRLLYETGIYTDSIHYGLEADTIYQLSLTVNETKYHYESISLCQGETYTRNGVLYTEPGLHHDTLTSASGCDSIVTFYLQWTPTYLIEEEKTLNGTASYDWHGRILTESGVYYDSASTVLNGCDSVYKLTLKINPTYKIDTTVNVCETELPYIWQGIEYYNTGVYEKLYHTVAGADSLLTLHLTVNQTAFTSLNLIVCEGDSFIMGDSVWKEPGIYYDTLITTHGCDSIVQVIINRGNSYQFEEIRTIYSDETIEWHGQTIQNEGIYVDNQKSVTGCDSIYTLKVTKKPTIETIEYDTICYSEAPYAWGGRNLYKTGTYTDTLFEAGSTLNIKTLYLTVNQTSISEQERFICKGESYPFFDQILTTADTYEHHLLTAHGCDSTIILHLNVMTGFEFNEEKTISDKELPYHWQGRDLYAGGEHVAEYKTMHEACDSIYHLTLTVLPTYADTVRKTVCANELPFEWEGTKYYTAGEFDKYYQTVVGKQDSTIHLSLTVSGSEVVAKSIQLCPGSFFELNGQHITAPGIYDDTIPNMLGCDSITRYVVNFAPLQFRETEASVCKGSTYNWEHGGESMVVDRQGTYLDTIRSKNGCDSIIYRLKLNLAEPFYHRDVDTICQSEAISYSYRGHYLPSTIPGTYHLLDQYNTINGCDSTYEMIVTVRTQELTTVLSIDLCEGESYTTVSGKVLDSNCEWNDTIGGKTCCDSILHYAVSVHPKYEFTTEVALCGSDVYNWEGKTIAQAGTYIKTYQSVYGCDSVQILIATQAPDYHFTDEVKVTNDMLPYVWHDQQCWETKSYEDQHYTTAGCDSIYTLNLTVLPWHESAEEVLYLCGDESITINGVTYSEAGHYSQKMYRAGESIADSIYHFELKKAPIYKVYDGVTVCESEFENGVAYHYYNSDKSQVFDITEKTDKVYEITFKTLDCGCDSTIELHFNYQPVKTVKRVINVCEGDYYLFRGIKYTTTSSFNDTLKTIDGCDSITYYQLNFVPNPEHFEADTMPANGQYVWKGHKNDTILTRSGLYFDYIASPTGCGTNYKLQLFEPSTSYKVENTEICVNQTIEWHGQIINETGLYYDTVTSMIDGTDSIYVLNLTTRPVDTVKITQQLCEGEKLTLTINGEEKTYTKTGFYSPFDNGNCGTQYLIDLTVNPKYIFPTVEAQICDKEVPYEWRGKYYYSTGLRYDSLHTIHGCDSVYSLNLTVWKSAITEKTIDLCEGDFEYIGGQKVSQQGVYDDSLYTVHGCDSIVRYRVNVHRNYYDTTSYVLCAGDSYEWHEQTITAPGTYRDSKTTQYGCDSIYVLYVSQAPTFSSKKIITIDPDSLPYQWQGNEYWYSGNYTDEHKTVMGCDSVYELELTVIDHISKDSLIYFCGGSTIYINNKPYSTEGQYSQKIRRPGQNVVDSIFRFTLKKAPIYMNYDSIVVCDSEFENGGIVYIYKDQVSGQSFHITEKKDSVYQFHFESIYGCDSVVELHFGYRPIKVANRVVEICEGDYYLFRGTKYTNTCTFSDTLKTVDGCDSITRYHLNVKESPTIIETDTIDNNSSFVVWHGHKNDTIITKPGLYTDRMVGPNGCDITYKLIVFKREGIANSETVTICENQKPYIWHNHNMSFNQSGIYFDSLTSKVDGSDSIFVLNLTILPTDTIWEERQICQGDTIDFYDQRVYKEGHYTYMDPTGCGTFYILDLMVNRTYSYTKKDYICENDLPYEWRDQEYSVSGTYEDRYTTINGCDSIYKLELTVWPTPAPTMINKTLCPGDYMDIHGKHITEAGLYDDTLRTEHGCDSIVRYYIQYTGYQQKFDSASINYGESYTWVANHETYHESGNYEHIVKSKLNPTCDSIVYHLHLIVDNFMKLNICQGDEFQFRGQSHIITTNTIFTDTLYDDHGNKTVQKYILNVLPTYNFIEYRTLCSSDYYPWHGQILHQAGVYYDRNLTVNGCDSIYEIHITLAETFDERTDALLMPEELPYTWRGRQFWVDTMQVDSFRTYAGCDSLYTLDLRLCNKYNSKIDTFTMCPGTTIVVAGREYDHGGMYKLQYATATSGNRPDSIYRFFIKELKSEYSFDSLRVAESEFTNGIVYNYKGLLNITSKKDSVYKISTSTEDGCESVIELHFGVLRSKYTTVPMTVCQGTMIWYNNSWNRVENNGIITDKLFTSEGGDSIVTYVINILPTPMTEHEIRLCNNDTFKISRVGGQRPLLITEPGIYLDTLTSHAGCDSIIKYIANRAESYFIERIDSVTKGGTYMWHRDGQDRLLTGAGVYWDSCRTVHGCDSIYKLTLVAVTEPQATHNIHLCSGDSIILRDENGKPYAVTEPGIYYEKLWNAAGQQDSIIRYIVNRALSYTINDTVTIERGETYHWADTIISNAGDYRRTLLTIDGCDSVFNLHLIIDNTYRSEERLTICYEERPLLWRGQQCFFSGTYYDSIHSDFAGDEVYHLELTVLPEIEKTLVEAKLCYGDVLYIRDQRIDKAGTYYDTLTSKTTGCDSVIQYIVNEYPTFKYEETRVMCNGGSVTWRDKIYTREGIYWDSLQTIHGCDSVFKLTVINSNTYALDTTIVWCWDDLPYRHYNGRYSTYYDVKDFPRGARTFIDTLTASSGCDSIIRTHVILTNKCNRELDTIYYCQGQEFPNIIGGQAIDHEGVYYFNEWTFDGYSAKLDSVHRAIAIEARTYYFYESYTACQGDMTEVHDGFIPGSYPVGERTIPVYLKTQHGCDSIYYIDLTVYPSYHHNVSNWQMRDIDIDYLPFQNYKGEEVTFVINGSQCTPGKHDTLLVTRTETGCEETFNLTLTVVPTTYKTDSVRICYLNLPYTYQDYNPETGLMETKEADEEGVYVSHYYRPGGNVSTVTTINLYVDTEAKLDTAWVEINCQQTKGGSSDMAIMFESSGSRPTEYDLVFSKNALSEGFANVKGAKVTKSGQIDVQWPTFKQSEKYVRPDNTYYVDVTLTNGACGTSADNTRRLYFGVKYPAWITESLFNHTIAILNENYNGGYIFSNYSWFVNDSYVPTDKPYIYDPDGTIISDGDWYHVELTRLGENYSIPTCDKQYTPGQPVTGRPRLINAASGNQHAMPIRMKAYGDGTYYIYSQTGQFCGSGEFHQGEQDILLPEVKGCYIIRMQQTDGESNSEKAMIF